MNDHFKNKAEVWDKGNTRVNGAKVISEAITANINLTKKMKIMDFGVGTGLLGFEIAKVVKEVVGVDISASMLDKLQEKNPSQLSIRPLCQDIVKNPINDTFDGIISSMTLHHVKNLKLFFETIYKNLNKNGFIAIADLETEDGTFHSDNIGVFHFGFNQDELKPILLDIGFKNITFKNINTIEKPHRDFDVFLLYAHK